MLICPYCGAENADGSKFCGNCGGSMEGAQPAPAAQPAPDSTVYGSFDADSVQNAGPTFDVQQTNTQEDFSSNQQTYDQQSGNQQNGYQQSGYQQPYVQPQNLYPPAVVPYSTGGLIAWSIITIFLCTIPGVIGLVNTLAINKATTPDEQARKIKNAKMWCLIGTVLGILSVLGAMVSGGQ